MHPPVPLNYARCNKILRLNAINCSSNTCCNRETEKPSRILRFGNLLRLNAILQHESEMAMAARQSRGEGERARARAGERKKGTVELLKEVGTVYWRRTVPLNKLMVEKNPTPYWTLFVVSRIYKHCIKP